MKRSFWQDPGYSFFLVISGLFVAPLSALLGYWAARDRGMVLTVAVFSAFGSVLLCFVALFLLLYTIWFVCNSKAFAQKEIREFLPKYRPLTFRERLFRCFDYSKLE